MTRIPSSSSSMRALPKTYSTPLSSTKKSPTINKPTPRNRNISKSKRGKSSKKICSLVVERITPPFSWENFSATSKMKHILLSTKTIQKYIINSSPKPIASKHRRIGSTLKIFVNFLGNPTMRWRAEKTISTARCSMNSLAKNRSISSSKETNATRF